jgi:TPR repeat protein
MRDKGMASSWYQRAADSGNAAAQVSLDGRYALGDGVTQDQGGGANVV